MHSCSLKHFPSSLHCPKHIKVQKEERLFFKLSLAILLLMKYFLSFSF